MRAMKGIALAIAKVEKVSAPTTVLSKEWEIARNAWLSRRDIWVLQWGLR
jgi:hypothetical protein